MSLALSALRNRDRVLLVEPGRLHPAVSFARASTATYMGSDGLLHTAAVNAPRYEYDNLGNYLGLLIEEARTNALLNSATLSTQSVTVTAAPRTLSFYGTGTVTLSGAFSGSLVGTGASNRVTLTFTPTAGTLTLTVSGSVSNAQLEIGAFATSYIPTTSAAVTRSADVANISALSKIGFSSLAATVFSEYSRIQNVAFCVLFEFVNTAAYPTTDLTNCTPSGVGEPRYSVQVGGIVQLNTTNQFSAKPVGTAIKSAIAYVSGSQRAARSGVLSTAGSGTYSPFSNYNQMNIGGSGNDIYGPTSLNFLNGHIKTLTYYPRRLPDSELQRLTA